MKLAILQPVLIPDLHDPAMMPEADAIVYRDSETRLNKHYFHDILNLFRNDLCGICASICATLRETLRRPSP